MDMTYPFMMTSNQHPSRHHEKSCFRNLYQKRLDKREKTKLMFTNKLSYIAYKRRRILGWWHSGFPEMADV